MAKTIQVSKPAEFSDAQLYDMVHQAAIDAGKESEFLVEFGSRRAYLRKVKGA